jgi:phosphate-selective porin
MKKSLVAPLLLALLAVPAAAQDTTAQAAAQEKRIQELEKKVDDLTAKKAKAEQARPAAEAKAEAKEAAGKNPEIDGLSVNLTGRAFLDGTWFSGSNNNLAGGMFLRVARLGFKATMGPKWYAETEFDFSFGAIAYKDIFLQYNGLKNQTIQVGHVKAPMGFETMMSDNDTWLLERSFADLWNPSRHVGVYYTVSNERLYAKAGVFGQSLDDTVTNYNDASTIGYKLVDSQGYGGAVRLAGLPLRKDETHLIHLGVAVSDWMPAAAAPGVYAVDFSGRPSVGKIDGAKFLNASVTNVNNNLEYGTEFAGQWGAFSWLGEYQWMKVNRKSAPDQVWDSTNLKLVNATAAQRAASVIDHNFTTWYFQVSYVINGQKEYRAGEDFLFKKTTPRTKAGALELVARYEEGNQDDITAVDPVKGGIEKIFTLGATYYPRKNIRLMANYGFVDNNANAMCAKGFSPTGAKIQDPHFTTFSTRVAFAF